MANCRNKTGASMNVKAKNFLFTCLGYFFLNVQQTKVTISGGVYVCMRVLQDTLTDHYADF